MSGRQASVRHGLRELVASWPEWQEASLALLRNRLLDQCGGDARPYVALVVRAAELGVPQRVLAWSGSGVAWRPWRSSLIVTLVSEAFLRPEMATWVVDTWGIALMGAERLGVAAADDVTAAHAGVPEAPAAMREERGERERDDGARLAGLHGALGRPANGHGSSPLARAPRAPVALRPAQRRAPSLMAPPLPAPLPGTRTGLSPAPPPEWLNHVTRVSLLVIVSGLLFLIVQVVRSERGGAGRRAASSALPPGAVAPVVRPASVNVDSAATPPAAVAATPMSRLARSTMPPAANDSSRLLLVRPPTRAQGRTGPGATVLEGQVALLATSKADRLSLRSGRVLTGRVEIVRASVVVFRDAESGLRYEVPKGDIAEITTEFGTTVRFGAAGDPRNERRAPLVARGLGGMYRVSYTFRDVRGSPECQRTAAQAIAPDVMRIDHRPGADTLDFEIVNGSRYYGVVDADGVFTTALALQPDQARESSAYTSRFSGRFTPGGFNATFDLIAYRRSRVGRDIACHTTLDAIGEREGPPSPAPPPPPPVPPARPPTVRP